MFRSVLSGRCQIGLAKVVADKQQRASSVFGRNIGKAIAKVQPGRMAPFAPQGIRVAHAGGDGGVDGDDFDLKLRKQVINQFGNIFAQSHDLRLCQRYR